MTNVAVLFCTPASVYKTLGVECFDQYRDARTYHGHGPVVAHPPCRAFGRLRHMAKPRADEFALGLFAVQVVRRCGGVLEHPAGSLLWSDLPQYNGFTLPAVGHCDEFGGTTVSVYQSDFGHPAPKHTWLYIVGHSRPGELCKARAGELSKARPGDLRKVVNQPAARRMDTPEPFARLLIELAGACE